MSAYSDDDVRALARMICTAGNDHDRSEEDWARDMLDHLTAAGWAKRADVLEDLIAMSEDDRGDILRHFCSECWRLQNPERPCQCWNDE